MVRTHTIQICLIVYPQKPARVMYESLTKLYEKCSQSNVLKNDDADEFSAAMAHFDQDFKRKKQIVSFGLVFQL